MCCIAYRTILMAVEIEFIIHCDIPRWISCCLCCISYRTILMAVEIVLLCIAIYWISCCFWLVCIAIYLDGYHVALVVRPCGGWLDLVTPPTCTGQAVW